MSSLPMNFAEEDDVIEVGSTTWDSEDEYDEYGEPKCICCPSEPEEEAESPTSSDDESPSPVPVDDVIEELTLSDRVLIYEAEREKRHTEYAKWCLEAWINLASYSLNTDEAGREAFRRLPNWEIVSCYVNEALAREYSGTGKPPRMM